jgi:hypothetical protein
MRVYITANERGGVRLTYLITDGNPPAGAIVMTHDEVTRLAEKTPIDLWQIADGELRFSASPIVPVPMRICMWQLEAVLREQGLYDMVDISIANSRNIVAKTAWAKAPYVSRSSELLAFFAEKLGISSDELDSIFVDASKIKG